MFRCSEHRDPVQLQIRHAHESDHTGGSNRRQMPRISIHRAPWNIDFLLAGPFSCETAATNYHGS